MYCYYCIISENHHLISTFIAEKERIGITAKKKYFYLYFNCLAKIFCSGTLNAYFPSKTSCLSTKK